MRCNTRSARPKAPTRPALYRELSGTQHLNDVNPRRPVPLSAAPLAPIPVTYIKAFDDIRALFAAQPDAKRKKLLGRRILLQRTRWSL